MVVYRFHSFRFTSGLFLPCLKRIMSRILVVDCVQTIAGWRKRTQPYITQEASAWLQYPRTASKKLNIILPLKLPTLPSILHDFHYHPFRTVCFCVERSFRTPVLFLELPTQCCIFSLRPQARPPQSAHSRNLQACYYRLMDSLVCPLLSSNSSICERKIYQSI